MGARDVTQNMFVGVDVGGTKVAAGIVDADGQILASHRKPMICDAGPVAALASVTEAIDALLLAHPIARETMRGIGICAPGPLDPSSGVIINPPNLKCWHNFPLAAEVSRRYGVDVKIDNDANAAALAEVLWGAGRGYKNVFYTCIGTGIGTGIVFDGQIYHGRTGAAAEGGHVSIDYQGPVCGCGKRGCIEVLAAGPAIARRAQAKLGAQPERRSVLRAMAQDNPGMITSELVGEASAAGDAVAKEILLETVELLSFWLGNIIDFLEPEVVILGGGVAAMIGTFFEELRKGVSRYCLNSRCHEIPLVMAHYAADSGIAGGAALCTRNKS